MKQVGIVLVLFALVFLAAGLLGAPGKLYELLHHTRKLGSACEHAYERGRDNQGRVLVCRISNGKLVWSR